MKIIGVIPARYHSSRFPRKPLADICGKPMIWWIYNQCKKVEDFWEVYVTTDDEGIFEACESLNMKAIMASSEHSTGTDRIGEVLRKTPANLVVNIQEDELLLEPETIRVTIKPFYKDPSLQITNLMTKITDPVDAINCTVPKVITNKNGIGVFLTRVAAQYPKASINYGIYKQVCVYGSQSEALEFFCDYSQKYGKAKIEEIEVVEILKFIENGYKVQYIEVNSETVVVDTPNDLEKVKKIVKQKFAGWGINL